MKRHVTHDIENMIYSIHGMSFHEWKSYYLGNNTFAGLYMLTLFFIGINAHDPSSILGIFAPVFAIHVIIADVVWYAYITSHRIRYAKWLFVNFPDNRWTRPIKICDVDFFELD